MYPVLATPESTLRCPRLFVFDAPLKGFGTNLAGAYELIRPPQNDEEKILVESCLGFFKTFMGEINTLIHRHDLWFFQKKVVYGECGIDTKMGPFKPLQNTNSQQKYAKTMVSFSLFLFRCRGAHNLPIFFSERDLGLIQMLCPTIDGQNLINIMEKLLLFQNNMPRCSFLPVVFLSLSCVGVGSTIIGPGRRTQTISHFEWFLRAFALRDMVDNQESFIWKLSSPLSGLNTCAWALRECKRLLFAAIDPLERSVAFEWLCRNNTIVYECLVLGNSN